MTFILFKTLHLLAVLILFGCLAIEFFMVKESLSKHNLKRIAFVDAFYGISAVIVLGSGLFMVFKVGKGMEFYGDNLALYIKIAIFVIIALLSILPTIFFIKHSKGVPEQTVQIPITIRRIILCELLLVLTLPFFAVLLANNFQPF